MAARSLDPTEPPFTGVMRDRRWAVWLLVGLAWTLFGLILASGAVYRAATKGEPFPWDSVLLALGGDYTWAVLTPFVFRIADRHPLTHDRWRASLGVHLLALLVLIPIDTGTYAVLEHTLFPAYNWGPEPPTLPRKFLLIMSTAFGSTIFWYWGVVGLHHALRRRRQLREGEVTTARLEAELSKARLQVLTMQLQPHFLFNALHAVSALVNEDPRAANRMLTRLGDLLRLSLEHDGRQEISLQQELECLAPYLQIEQIRFQDRLTVRTAIAPEALSARVPSLILQPLVENAIRHGIAPRAGPGRIEIRAQRRDGVLELEVEDDGRGVAVRGGPDREGVGLRNTRARLWQLYGAGQRLELAAAPGGGTLVRLQIPYAPAEGMRADWMPAEGAPAEAARAHLEIGEEKGVSP